MTRVLQSARSEVHSSHVQQTLLSQPCVGMYTLYLRTVASSELSRQQNKEPQLLSVCLSVCVCDLCQMQVDFELQLDFKKIW